MILTTELQKFINDNLDKNIKDLAFQKNPFKDYDWKWILNQIQAKQKAEKKLPTWFTNDNIIFPSVLSIEQTSSEILANYKSSLISGNKIIDLTGGFGVDDFYFSKKFQQVIHCELQEELSTIVRQNFSTLNATNISCITGDSIAYLENSTETYDWIFIDPARRDNNKSKVFLLKDCTPNVVDLQVVLFQKSENILIKVAPLLDISSILNEIKHVKEIYVVSLQNEVKELLIVLKKGFIGQPKLIATNINNNEITSDIFPLEDDESVNYEKPLTYLYEPFSSYLKVGKYNYLGNKYNASKLQKHSHLYTSKDLIDFPGRLFQIQKIIPYSKKEIKFLENTKCNVTVRNFPLKVEDIRKKHKLKDGGDLYVFFTTDKNNQKIVIICKKTTTDL